MKKEIMELWTKALRSGEFEQGRYKLYSSNYNTYCVLGVLCTLAMVEGICDYTEVDGRGIFDGEFVLAPKSVLEWAGMENITIPGKFVSLTGYNDHGWDFDQLADLIEDNYEQL